MIRCGVFALQGRRKTGAGVVFTGSAQKTSFWRSFLRPKLVRKGDWISYTHNYNLSIIGPDTNYIVVIVHLGRANASHVNDLSREVDHRPVARDLP